MGDVAGLASTVEADFAVRFPDMNKARRRGVAQVVAAMLTARTANMVELGNVLPRAIASWEKRYQFVERIVSHERIGCDAMMASYAGEVARQLTAKGGTLIVMMDQSHINDLNEVLMVSLSFGGRALPVAWRVKQTQGAIGFGVQKPLLDAVKAMLPQGVPVLLCADRLYGTPALIDWCVAAGWDYRIRLKSNLIVNHQGGEMTSGEVLSLAPEGLVAAKLNGASSATNIFALHEPGHAEPWIIAMAAKPGRTSCLDYGLRWGIEAMFSDYKSLRLRLDAKPDRKAGEAGKTDSDHGDSHVLGGLLRHRRSGRERARPPLKKTARSLCSYFKKGLRFLRRYFAMDIAIPKLWSRWNL